MRSHREKEKLFSSCINQKALKKEGKHDDEKKKEHELVFLWDWVWCVVDMCWTWTCGAYIDACESGEKGKWFLRCFCWDLREVCGSKGRYIVVDWRSLNDIKKLRILLTNHSFAPWHISRNLKKSRTFPLTKYVSNFYHPRSKINIASLLNFSRFFSFSFRQQDERTNANRRERESSHVLRRRRVYST